jgi:hypothetical protein
MPIVASISQQIWDMKYRLKGPDGAAVDKTIEDTWRRVAKAGAPISDWATLVLLANCAGSHLQLST